MRTLLDFNLGFGEVWSVYGLKKLGYHVTSNVHSDASRSTHRWLGEHLCPAIEHNWLTGSYGMIPPPH